MSESLQKEIPLTTERLTPYWGSWDRPLFFWLLAAFGIPGIEICLERLPAPFVWIAVFWLALFSVSALRTRSQGLRIILINSAAVVATLGAFEGYLWLTQPEGGVERYTGYTVDYFLDHPHLGYAPQRGIQSHVGKYHRDELVYRAKYSIDGDGLRVSPVRPDGAHHALFFGGSNTFGEGVDDEEAMPYRVGKRAGSDLQVYNFGFHGYGPHQMLAALEYGLVDEVVPESPGVTTIYQAIPAHVARSAGRASWDRHGPRYRLDDQGRARFAGHFDDDKDSLWGRIATRLERSLTFVRLLGRESPISDTEIRLYVEVVAAARDLALSRAERSQFHVLLWGYEGEPLFDKVVAGLRGKNISVHLISAILPYYVEDPARYTLGIHDEHPNALAHDLIAEYVVSEIIEPQRSTQIERHYPSTDGRQLMVRKRAQRAANIARRSSPEGSEFDALQASSQKRADRKLPQHAFLDRSNTSKKVKQSESETRANLSESGSLSVK